MSTIIHTGHTIISFVWIKLEEGKRIYFFFHLIFHSVCCHDLQWSVSPALCVCTHGSGWEILEPTYNISCFGPQLRWMFLLFSYAVFRIAGTGWSRLPGGPRWIDRLGKRLEGKGAWGKVAGGSAGGSEGRRGMAGLTGAWRGEHAVWAQGCTLGLRKPLQGPK